MHARFTVTWGFMDRVDRAPCPTPDPIPKETPMKRLIPLLLLAAFSASTLTACNTMSGVGKDIEAAGDKIDDKAQDCKDAKC